MCPIKSLVNEKRTILETLNSAKDGFYHSAKLHFQDSVSLTTQKTEPHECY